MRHSSRTSGPFSRSEKRSQSSWPRRNTWPSSCQSRRGNMAKGLTVTAVNTYKELLKSDFKKAKKMLEDLAQDARLAIMWEIAQESNIVALARREKELEKELSDVQDKMKKFTDNHYYNNWKIVLDKKTDQRMQERF